MQERLQSAAAKRRGAKPGVAATGPAPLKGRFRDETGDQLTPTHTRRRGKRLRIVESRTLPGAPGSDPPGSIEALQEEGLLMACGGGTRLLRQDLHNYRTQISKTSATGGEFTMSTDFTSTTGGT